MAYKENVQTVMGLLFLMIFYTEGIRRLENIPVEDFIAGC